MRKMCLTIIFSLCACSSQEVSSAPPPVPPESVNYIELFMSRASATQAEFEQYKVSEGGIFVECGEVVRGRPKPRTQDFRPASLDVLDALAPLAKDVGAIIKKENPSLDPPSPGDSMFDAGVVTLAVGIGSDKVDISTSVNAIANAVNPPERKIRRLVQAIREATGNDDCGKNSFYGINPKN